MTRRSGAAARARNRSGSGQSRPMRESENICSTPEQQQQTGDRRGHPERPRRAARRGIALEPTSRAGWPHGIVEQHHAERDRQHVEEAVVAGGEDQQLEARRGHERDEALARAAPDEHRNAELDRRTSSAQESCCAHAGRRFAYHADPGRQRLRPVVVFERRQVSPRGIAREQLHRAGAEHQTEQQPAEHPDDRFRRRRFATQARPEIQRRDEDRQESRLDAAGCPIGTRGSPGRPPRARGRRAKVRRGREPGRCRRRAAARALPPAAHSACSVASFGESQYSVGSSQ